MTLVEWREWVASRGPGTGVSGAELVQRRAGSAPGSLTTVIDASALVDLLIGATLPGAGLDRWLGAETRLTTLDLADLEVMSSLRQGLCRGRIDASVADAAVGALSGLTIHREPASPLRERVWQLRETHTPYDAAYVALAERMGAPLVTTDRRLARSHGHEAEIIDLSA
jgi:predicted nucleic acid-binding protein